MPAEPFGRFPVARTSDFDEAQGALEATFVPLRMRCWSRTAPLEAWISGSTRPESGT